jgi:hypothetical protein
MSDNKLDQKFHLGDLLSVTTGRLVAPGGIDAVYRLVNFITGEEHMTHQLPRATVAVTPWLLELYPWLTQVVVPADLRGEENVSKWLLSETDSFGEFHMVAAMPPGMYVVLEPIAEMAEMMGLVRRSGK